MSSQPKTFTDILLAMEVRGSRPCFSYIPDGHLNPVVSLSYSEMLDRSLRFGSALKGQGVGRGDR